MSASAQLPTSTPEIVVERFKYIQDQIKILNENTYKILGIYQTLTTAVVTAAIALFVGFPKLTIEVDVARAGLTALLLLATAIAVFTILLLAAGILSWFDYRQEEVELLNTYFYSGFRKSPSWKNFFRWYETWIAVAIVVLTILMWVAYRVLAAKFLVLGTTA